MGKGIIKIMAENSPPLIKDMNPKNKGAKKS